MAIAASLSRYSRRARWFHWLAFGFVALAYALINLVDGFPRGSDARALTMQSHMLAGLVVLALVLPRLLHRWQNAPPPVTPPLADWERSLSRLTHGALYAFLLVQPLLGLLTVFSAGRGVVIPFTGLELPSPLPRDPALHESMEEVHGWVGTIFYYVIGLHILAALWHHFVRRDDALRRML